MTHRNSRWSRIEDSRQNICSSLIYIDYACSCIRDEQLFPSTS